MIDATTGHAWMVAQAKPRRTPLWHQPSSARVGHTRARPPCGIHEILQPVTGLGTPLLVGLFTVAAAATWVAGMALSKTTDALDVRFDLGSELGGLLLLSVAGSLPELAITISAAAQGHLGLAAGNLLDRKSTV